MIPRPGSAFIATSAYAIAVLVAFLALFGLIASGCAEGERGHGVTPPPGFTLVPSDEEPDWPDGVIWEAEFGVLAPGAATDPAGVTYTRASAATTLHPIVASRGASGFGKDKARIVKTTSGVTGLFVEGAATNLHASDAPWDSATWTGAPSAGASTVEDTTTADPAGVPRSALHTVPPGGYGRHDGAANSFPPSVMGNLVTSHMWAKGTGTLQSTAYDGALVHSKARALGGGWEHVANTFIAAGRTRSILPADGRDEIAAGGAKAGVRSYRTARHMVEIGPRASSFIGPGKTRAGAHCSVPDVAALAPGGRLRLEITWVAPYASDALPWSPRLWTIGPSDHAEIDMDTRCIRVVVAGVAAWVSAPITWAAGDTVSLRLDAGGGPTTGSVQVAGGRVSAIHDGRTLPPLPAAGALDIACDGAARQLEGVHTRWRVWERSGRSRTVVVGDTEGLVAALATTTGPARILMRGGTYRIDQAITMTSANSGVALAAYPGETPILDGGEVVAGSWTGPDDRGVFSIPYAGHSRQIWVNGRRATRARSAGDPEGWKQTASGFVAPSAAEAAKVGLDGEIVGRNLWRMFRVGVASIAGAEIEVRAADWADARSMAPLHDMDAVWWAEGKGYVGDRGGHFWHDRAAGVLHYKPRKGEDMATAEVVAGVVERAFAVLGTLDAPARDITVSGITVRHTTWTGPDADGASNIQSSIMWRGGAAGDVYVKPPAAIVARAAHRLTITGCTFTGIGSDAVSLEYGTQDSAVVDCAIDDVAAAAVSVGDVTHLEEDPRPSDARAILARDVVANNLIRDVARDYHGSNAVFGAYTSGLVVARNDIDGTPYTAIALGWGWGYNDPPGVGGSGWPAGVLDAPTAHTPLGNNRVVKNRVTSFLKKLDDGGAVYALAKQSNGGRTVIANNHVVSSVGSGPNQAGVYLDNGCVGVDVRANVFEEVQGAFVMTQASFIPLAVGNTVIGNHADAGFYTTAPDNTVAANAVGALGAPALAIKAAAGRIR